MSKLSKRPGLCRKPIFLLGVGILKCATQRVPMKLPLAKNPGLLGSSQLPKKTFHLCGHNLLVGKLREPCVTPPGGPLEACLGFLGILPHGPLFFAVFILSTLINPGCVTISGVLGVLLVDHQTWSWTQRPPTQGSTS